VTTLDTRPPRIEPPPPAPVEAEPGRPRKRNRRTRSERRLGLMLCAPAVFVMVAVTAYPVGYAIYLSLQRADLRFPDATKWVGFDNYWSVLSAHLWWQDVWTTVEITIISVAIELVLGMALAYVMHRALVGRGLIRSAILVPYAMITVIAAIAWKYAFTPGTGFIDSCSGPTRRG
jgi:multiple sugar transport system permease protein